MSQVIRCITGAIPRNGTVLARMGQQDEGDEGEFFLTCQSFILQRET